MRIYVGAACDSAGAACKEGPDDQLVISGQGVKLAVWLGIAGVNVSQDVGEVSAGILGSNDVVKLGQTGNGGGS